MSLQEKYRKEIAIELKEKFGYKNILAVPRVEKIVVNVGVGKNFRDEKTRTEIKKNLSAITGQKPAETTAKKDIAGFKLRRGTTVGLKVTLRGARMHDFLERLIRVALPRTRDFKGIPLKSLDKKGNVNIGVKEYTVFPEINNEEVGIIFGLEITIVTTAKTDKEAVELLRLMGFPWQKSN